MENWIQTKNWGKASYVAGTELHETHVLGMVAVQAKPHFFEAWRSVTTILRNHMISWNRNVESTKSDSAESVPGSRQKLCLLRHLDFLPPLVLIPLQMDLPLLFYPPRHEKIKVGFHWRCSFSMHNDQKTPFYNKIPFLDTSVRQTWSNVWQCHLLNLPQRQRMLSLLLLWSLPKHLNSRFLKRSWWQQGRKSYVLHLCGMPLGSSLVLMVFP